MAYNLPLDNFKITVTYMILSFNCYNFFTVPSVNLMTIINMRLLLNYCLFVCLKLHVDYILVLLTSVEKSPNIFSVHSIKNKQSHEKVLIILYVQNNYPPAIMAKDDV